MYIQYYNSPIGRLGIIADDDSIVKVLWPHEQADGHVEIETAILKQAKLELNEYFTGKRKDFSVKVTPYGTSFQQIAWAQLKQIPYAKTISYQQQASNIGDQKKCRSIGVANGKNPIPVIIPCHRVIGKNGKLTGFAGGINAKQFLLEHEKRYA